MIETRTLLYMSHVRVYSRPVLNRGGIWCMRLLGGRFFGVGPNGPFFGCVNALINPPPALAWRSFLANLQENGFKKTPLGWIVFVVGWRWGSPEGTSGPFCAHELLHTNFVHRRCTNRFVVCTNRFLGPFRIFWRSHPRRGLV